MFLDAHQRRFDVVLFWSLDRFSREGVTETLNHLQRLNAAGMQKPPWEPDSPARAAGPGVAPC